MKSKSNLPFPLNALLEKNKSASYINSIEVSAHQYDVFIDTDIEEPSEYRDLLSILFGANEYDTVNLFINSNGGNLDTALAIVEGLKCTNARVTAHIIGACHSAASIISMYCHEVAVLDSAYSMVHTATFGSFGNTGNVRAHTDFTVKMVERLLHETYEGFLNAEELHKVKTGVELWFDADEIRERMGRRVKYLEAKQKKMIKAMKAQSDAG